MNYPNRLLATHALTADERLYRVAKRLDVRMPTVSWEICYLTGNLKLLPKGFALKFAAKIDCSSFENDYFFFAYLSVTLKSNQAYGQSDLMTKSPKSLNVM